MWCTAATGCQPNCGYMYIYIYHINRKALFVYSENHMKSINIRAKCRVLDLLGLHYNDGFRHFRQKFKHSRFWQGKILSWIVWSLPQTLSLYSIVLCLLTNTDQCEMSWLGWAVVGTLMWKVKIYNSFSKCFAIHYFCYGLKPINHERYYTKSYILDVLKASRIMYTVWAGLLRWWVWRWLLHLCFYILGSAHIQAARLTLQSRRADLLRKAFQSKAS
jgi:hypothetical protein